VPFVSGLKAILTDSVPFSANFNAASSSSSRPAPPKLNTASLHLAIPSGNSFSCLHSAAEEGYEGSAGTTTTAAGGGPSTNIVRGSIYPDTVPYGRNGQVPDTYALTNDLRRAIGGLSIEGSNGQSSEESTGASTSTGMKASSSVSSLDTTPSTSRTTGMHSPSTSIASTERTQATSVGQELEEESELQLKGNLEVLERLGEGASGEVRKARYKPSGMIMAMKVSLDIELWKRKMILNLYDRQSAHHPTRPFIGRFYESFLSIEHATPTTLCGITVLTWRVKTPALSFAWRIVKRAAWTASTSGAKLAMVGWEKRSWQRLQRAVCEGSSICISARLSTGVRL
jgi:hypothetical protein